MTNARVLAGVIFSSVLFAAMFSKRTSATLPPWGPPAPSVLPPPPVGPPKVPDPPWVDPPKPPQMFTLKAGRRYEVVADVQTYAGVGLTTAASKMLDALKLDNPSLRGYKDVERAGAGKVTRVTFQVTSLADNSFPLEHQLSTPAVGSVWVVSVKDVTR